MRFLRVLWVLLVVPAVLALSAAAHAERGGLPDLSQARDAELQRGLENVVRELGLANDAQAGRLSLAIVDLTDRNAPRLAMLNGDEMMYAASLPKIAILLAALAEAEAGRMSLDETRVRAMTSMIRYSSNEDAARVLGWVGQERLLEILQSPGYRFYDAAGAGGLWVGKGYGSDAAYRRDPVHNLSHGATAFQVARLYYLLANDHHADSALFEYGAHRYVIVGIAEHHDGGEWLAKLGLPLHRLLVGESPGTIVH